MFNGDILLSEQHTNHEDDDLDLDEVRVSTDAEWLKAKYELISDSIDLDREIYREKNAVGIDVSRGAARLGFLSFALKKIAQRLRALGESVPNEGNDPRGRHIHAMTLQIKELKAQLAAQKKATGAA